MAVFNQRAELSRQKRHMPAQWDESFGNKLLGFNEQGGRNPWGRVMGAIPGLNTATHAIAKKRASGATQDVLEETFDETVNKDFAKLAFGVNVAKTIVTGGLGGMGGGGGAMSGMFGGGGGAMSGAGGAAEAFGGMTKGAGMMQGEMGGAMSELSGAVEGSQVGGGMKDMFGDMFGDRFKDDDNKNMLSNFDNQIKDIQGKNMMNPHNPGTPEYKAFELAKEQHQKQENKSSFGSGAKNLFKSATTGNIFESGANLLGATITSEMATKSAISDAKKGEFAYNPTFNYL